MRPNSRSYFLPVTLWIGGLAAFAIVATMNATFAAKYGTSEFEKNVSVGAAVVIDAACLLLAATFGLTITLRRWMAMAISGVFMTIVVLMSMGTAVGYFGIARLAPAEASRINAERQAAASELVNKKLSDQADAWQTQVRGADKAADKRLLAAESRESILMMLKVPKVTAEEAVPDPLASTISHFTGMGESRAQALFLSVLAAILVLLKVVLVSFGSYLWPQASQSKAEVKQTDSVESALSETGVEEQTDPTGSSPPRGPRRKIRESNVVALSDHKPETHPYQADTVSAWLQHGQKGGEAVGEYNALYDRYAAWCADHGLDRVDGRREFGRHLRRLGCRPRRLRRGDRRQLQSFYEIADRQEAPQLPLAA